MLLLSDLAGAQRSSLGDTASALPGIVRVGVPASAEPRWALTGWAGYGYTESQVTGFSAHHRASGVLSAAVAPLRELEFALRFDGRYDWHPGEEASDNGLIGDPRVLARAGTVLSENLHLGGEVGIWVPGADAPSTELAAATLDTRLLAAWLAPRAGWTLAGLAGFRWDNSSKSAEFADRYSQADRVALGLSDFNAALVGAGLGYRVSDTEILAEVSGDLLIGAGAPSLSRSPLRVTAGPRHHLTPALQLGVVAEVSLSSRPGSAAGDPLVPIEPRFSVVAGVTYRGLFAQEPAATPAPPPPPVETRQIPLTAPPEPAQPPPAPSSVPVKGKVTDGIGTPITGAKVSLKVGNQSHESTTDMDGSFSIEEVPVGRGTATVTAPGFRSFETPLEVSARAPTTVNAQLEPDLPAAQIRGMVRSFQGRPLAARIVIDPPGTEASTDQNGLFQLNVEPGTYTVTVSADGYVEQRRTLKVDESAVVVFNADLLKKQGP